MSKIIYPISTSSFRTIRENGWFYVDKTAYIYRMATEGQYYFLSRPRRFGKSLLVSAMEAYFLGRKDLFSGLKIFNLEKDWIEYAVLHLDLSAGDMSSTTGLIARLEFDLHNWEEKYGSNEAETTLTTRFQGIIRRAARQSGKGVVILIDEYDNPLFSTIGNKTENEEIRKLLKGVYSILKAESDNIRFCFLTGITRFSKMSVFSGLNNLNDITLTPGYSGICGITTDELAHECKAGVTTVAKKNSIDISTAMERLKEMYDGYHFGALNLDIFNPYSLMHVFTEGQIKPYWFISGTSQFLWERIISHADRRSLKRMLYPLLTDTDLGATEDNGLSLSGLLFQTGYLTIKSYIPEISSYRLGIPNSEVREGILKGLLPLASRQDSETTNDDLYQLRSYASKGEVDNMISFLKSFLAGISYRLTKKEPEIYYENNLFLIFSLIGINTQVEMDSSDGRMDIMMRNGNYLYIIELKRDGSAEEALKQINEKDYSRQFIKEQMKNSNLQIISIGINFSSEKRNIDTWKYEKK
ncbi:MAG: ATP-binding protein [Muribaculaceae bacterium]|nr:ATP-binding protein [Muribaculaceae bacterium]